MRPLIAVLLLCAGGCANLSVLATHAPMHPVGAQAVTFKAQATGEVNKIVLSYSRDTVSASPAGGVTTTPADPEIEVKTCTGPETAGALSCAHVMPSAFPAGSLIRFRAVASGPRGSASEEYQFAAGDYPSADEPIPIRVKGDSTGRLDVIFIPDTDITLDSFRDNLDEVVENSYFKYEGIRSWRGVYNFYYSTQQGHYEELCSFTEPGNMARLSAVGDAVVFLHQATLRDCKSGKRISSEINNEKSLIHESGHVLFGLQDEYCCDSSYAQQGCNANLWSSLAACQAEAASIGHPASLCTQLGSASTSLGFWRIDPSDAGGCIMGPHQPEPDSSFGKACARRMGWRHGKCAGGDCFPAQECP